MDDQTESVLNIYVLPEAQLRAAIGSGQRTLLDAIAADRAYLAAATPEHFVSPDDLHEAAAQLIAGEAARNPTARGFATELLLRQLAPADGRFSSMFLGNWYIPAFTLYETGDRALSLFLINIMIGRSPAGSAEIAGLLGGGGVALNFCAIAPQEALGLRPLLQAIPPLARAFRDYRFGSGRPEDQKLEELIRVSDAGMADETGGVTEGPAFEAILLELLQERLHFFIPFESLEITALLMDRALSRAIARQELAIFAFLPGDATRYWHRDAEGRLKSIWD